MAVVMVDAITLSIVDVQAMGVERAFIYTFAKTMTTTPITIASKRIAAQCGLSFWKVYRALRKFEAEGLLAFARSKGMREVFAKFMPHISDTSQIAWLVKGVRDVDSDGVDWDIVLRIYLHYKEKGIAYVIAVVNGGTYWEMKRYQIKHACTRVEMTPEELAVHEQAKIDIDNMEKRQLAERQKARANDPQYISFDEWAKDMISRGLTPSPFEWARQVGIINTIQPRTEENRTQSGF